MRIIAGNWKGRRLASPSFAGLRPTSDRLRETLFNVLGDRVSGARVLDGFAGTGAVGLEALSRGARHVTFVEGDPRAVTLIRENVERCQAQQRCAIIRAQFTRLPARVPRASYDVIVLDPPYAIGGDRDGRPGGPGRRGEGLAGVLEAARERLIVTGLLVLEHSRRAEVPEIVAGLQPVRVLRSGDSMLTFFEPTPPESAASG